MSSNDGGAAQARNSPEPDVEGRYYWIRAAKQLKEKAPGTYLDFMRIQEQNRTRMSAAPDVNGAAAETNTSDAVEELLKNAEEHRKEVEACAWKLPFKVRQQDVKLRDCLKQVVKALKLFKDVGTAIASLDRIHAGIPWAAINVVLEGST
jgi:hypothetical protein